MGKQSVPFLGQTNIFGEAFPEVESFCVEYTEAGGYEGRITEPSRFVEEMRCGNARCKCGGYRLGNELRMMVLSHLEEKEDTLYCNGREGSHANAAPCSNVLKFKMKIVYRP